MRENAKTTGLSQNAYITYALIVEAIALHKPAPPQAALAALFGEMSAAIPDDENVLGECPESDWNALKPFIATLQAAGIIAGLKLRNGRPPATTTYSFRFTPEGREVWRAVAKRIDQAIAGSDIVSLIS